MPQANVQNIDIASKDEMQNLHAQVEKLITHHHVALKSEGVLNDVERIIGWIENCESGSAKAERKLYNEGSAILENIKARLQLALEEQQRIIEESPAVANNARGRETERFAKASRGANNALSTFSNLTDNNKE